MPNAAAGIVINTNASGKIFISPLKRENAEAAAPEAMMTADRITRNRHSIFIGELS